MCVQDTPTTQRSPGEAETAPRPGPKRGDDAEVEGQLREGRSSGGGCVENVEEGGEGAERRENAREWGEAEGARAGRGGMGRGGGAMADEGAGAEGASTPSGRERACSDAMSDREEGCGADLAAGSALIGSDVDAGLCDAYDDLSDTPEIAVSPQLAGGSTPERATSSPVPGPSFESASPCTRCLSCSFAATLAALEPAPRPQGRSGGPAGRRGGSGAGRGREVRRGESGGGAASGTGSGAWGRTGSPASAPPSDACTHAGAAVVRWSTCDAPECSHRNSLKSSRTGAGVDATPEWETSGEAGSGALALRERYHFGADCGGYVERPTESAVVTESGADGARPVTNTGVGSVVDPVRERVGHAAGGALGVPCEEGKGGTAKGVPVDVGREGIWVRGGVLGLSSTGVDVLTFVVGK